MSLYSLSFSLSNRIQTEMSVVRVKGWKIECEIWKKKNFNNFNII